MFEIVLLIFYICGGTYKKSLLWNYFSYFIKLLRRGFILFTSHCLYGTSQFDLETF